MGKYPCLRANNMDEIYIMESLPTSEHLKTSQIDTMIIAANDDIRTYEGLNKLAKQGITLDELYVLKFESQKTHPINLQYDSISTTEIELLDDMGNLDIELFKNKNILLDITGFSIPNLFRMLYILGEVLQNHDLHVLYTEPKHYIFGEDTFGSYAYYIGEREYKALDEFYVSGDDGRELLAIFLGFDRMTSSIVKDAVNPTETILVNGFPAMSPKLKDISLLNNRELISILGKPKYSVKTNNPFATYNTLSQIQREHSDMLINICVLGTKAMALGAGIYALQNKNIKLSYAHTKQYAAEISTGVSNTWYYYFKI